MRRLGVTVILVLALSLAATSATGARARRSAPPECLPAHSYVLHADAQAVVYAIVKREFESGGAGFVPTATNFGVDAIRGCAFGDRRSFTLTEEARDESVEVDGGIRRLKLAGHLVAYERWDGGVSKYDFRYAKTEWLVEVRDLRNGRVLVRVPTGEPPLPNPDYVGDGEVGQIALKANGDVAWIVDTGQARDRYQVRALDRGGSRLLASGTDIDPHSLKLAGDTLHWTQGGKSVSAALG